MSLTKKITLLAVFGFACIQGFTGVSASDATGAVASEMGKTISMKQQRLNEITGSVSF